MKIMKYLTIGLLFIGMTTLVGCKKEDMSKYATKDDLNNYATNSDLNNSQAKVFNFSLTFTAGSTFKSYSGVTGFEPGDIVVTYIKYETLGSETYWTGLPATIGGSVNFYPEFGEDTGLLYINTLNNSGNSPWTSSNTFAFKAVLIKANGLKANPNLDLSNLEKVSEAFDLK